MLSAQWEALEWDFNDNKELAIIVLWCVWLALHTAGNRCPELPLVLEDGENQGMKNKNKVDVYLNRARISTILAETGNICWVYLNH